MQLAKRGYQVTLAEAAKELGGRVTRESRLPGPGAWRRAFDSRVRGLQRRANVRIFLDSRLHADDVAELGIPNVFVATGASWRRDGAIGARCV